MTLDVVAYTILALFIGLGAWRGGAVTGAALASILLSYAAAVMGGGAFGSPVARGLGLPPHFGAPMAGVLCFLATYLACGIASAFVRKWDRLRHLDRPRSLGNRSLGAALGGIRGGLLVLLLVVLVSWLDAARDLGAMSGLDAVPDTQDSRVARASGGVMAGLAAGVLGDSGAASRLAVAVVENPSRALTSLRDVIEDPLIAELQGDAAFWTLVENGASERAVYRPSFMRLSQDREFVANLAELGLVDFDVARSPEAFRRFAEGQLDQLGSRLQAIRRDPELAELAEDPEVVAMLNSGDTLGLISHPGIQRLVEEAAGGSGGS